jgi:threonyl-tRNA synthetase
MDKLHNIRHTLAHLLAHAVKEYDPEVKLGIGPVTDDGFYYDFKFSAGKTPTPETLKELERAMIKLVNKKLPMTGKEISAEEGREMFVSQPFKTELINDYAEDGKTLTAYTVGDFTDLCKGGHAENTSEIEGGSFTLTKIAGAYWRGDQSRDQLIRIYGFAFETKAELEAHLTMLEEAKKRDHRKLGKELGLFTFSEKVGAGLPLWTPRGTILRELLNDYVWSLRKAKGYMKVCIPHITRQSLYETSGHWAKYADDLFKITTREGHVYAMKPMNCPHHTQIFDSEPRSYRDMPQRFAETTMVYRDEQSGELSGLARVLSITQDDAHVFCRVNQLDQEVDNVWDIIQTFYGTFGFVLTPRFSRRDMNTLDDYLGSSEAWDTAEGAIKSAMERHGLTDKDWIDGPGEAAFYGPKIDFLAKDSIGRTWQVATIQIDFQQPVNFGLTCTNEKGEKESIVMIHAAIMGSIERFLSTYIEHSAANFPLWLAPEQITILPVSEKHADVAAELARELRTADIRARSDDRNESLGKRLRDIRTMKTPAWIVIGDNEVSTGTFAVEHRDGQKDSHVDLGKLVEELTMRIMKKQ